MPSAPSPDLIITNARPWGGEPATVFLADGKIQRIEQGGAPTDAPGSPEVYDAAGRLLLPSFADVHVHLDSSRIGLPFRPHTGRPGVWGMMMNDRENWRQAEASAQERASMTLARMIAHGATRVRTYAQVDVDCRLERFEAVRAAAEEHRDRCELQIVAFPQAGLMLEEGSPAVLEQAVAEGADWVGGIDPCQLDRDPKGHLDVVFGLAEKYGKPVDIHLHEPAELGLFSTELILERTRALGMQGQVCLSHAYDLGAMGESVSARLIEQLAELDVSMTTIAPARHRSLPLPDLLRAGVRVGLGEDGQRDYWSPYGNGDMLDRTWQLAFTHGFRADDLIERCYAVASAGGASIMDRGASRIPKAWAEAGTTPTAPLGLEPGAPAELVLLEGETVTSAIMDRLPARTVFHRGRVVADHLELQ